MSRPGPTLIGVHRETGETVSVPLERPQYLLRFGESARVFRGVRSGLRRAGYVTRLEL